MKRRRTQNPRLENKDGSYSIRPYEDVLDENGKLVHRRVRQIIGPSKGPDKLSRQAAQRERQEKLVEVNRHVYQPPSVMTLSYFLENHFKPDRVDKMKKSGREHYKWCSKHIENDLGAMKLKDVDYDACSRFVGKREKQLSVKSVQHLKTALYTIFQHALRKKLYRDGNPAEFIELDKSPALIRLPKERYAYTFDQAKAILEEMQVLAHMNSQKVIAMSYLAMTTSMNIAEMAGLRWKRVNLTDEDTVLGTEIIKPRSAQVREQFYRGEWGTVKAGKRTRDVVLPDYVIEILREFKASSKFTGPNDPVFSSQLGTPPDAHDLAQEIFKPLRDKLKIPISWHCFRHSTATFCDALQVQMADREKIMGHANSQQTMDYTHSDIKRRRESQNKMAEKIVPDRIRQMHQLMNTKLEGPKQ